MLTHKPLWSDFLQLKKTAWIRGTVLYCSCLRRGAKDAPQGAWRVQLLNGY